MAGRELLSAVPVPARGASLTHVPGGVILSLRAEPPAGLSGWLVRALGLERSVSVRLDELGECYWSQLDGQRSLLEINSTLCARFSLPPAQARRAIIEFTAALMKRNLLALRLEEP